MAENQNQGMPNLQTKEETLRLAMLDEDFRSNWEQNMQALRGVRVETRLAILSATRELFDSVHGVAQVHRNWDTALSALTMVFILMNRTMHLVGEHNDKTFSSTHLLEAFADQVREDIVQDLRKGG